MSVIKDFFSFFWKSGFFFLECILLRTGRIVRRWNHCRRLSSVCPNVTGAFFFFFFSFFRFCPECDPSLCSVVRKRCETRTKAFSPFFDRRHKYISYPFFLPPCRERWGEGRRRRIGGESWNKKRADEKITVRQSSNTWSMWLMSVTDKNLI